MDAGLGTGRYDDPRWGYPEYPRGSVIELRVHGVGGESPERMTRDPHAAAVGGDELAGFWRSRDPVLGTIRDDGSLPSQEEPVIVREMMAWGGQTSGTWRHALWVLLTPFGLMNLVGQMHDDDVASRRARAYRTVARLLALTLTLGVVTLVCGIAYDLLLTQCDDACRTGAEGVVKTLLGPLRHGDDLYRTGLLTLLPVLVVLGLWWAGRYRTPELEGFSVEGEGDRGTASTAGTLADPALWSNAHAVSRLRAAHVDAGFAVIALTFASVVLARSEGISTIPWQWARATALVALVASLVVVTLPAVLAPRHVPWLDARVLPVVRVVSLLPLALAVGAAVLPELVGERALVIAILVLLAVGVWKLLSAGRGTVVKAPEGPAEPDAGGSSPAEPASTSVVRGPETGRGPSAKLAAAAMLVGGAGAATDAAVTGLPDPGGFADLLTVPGPILTIQEGILQAAYPLLTSLVVVQVLLVGVLGLLGGSLRHRAPVLPGRPGRAGHPALLGSAVALLSMLIATAGSGAVYAVVLEAIGDTRQRGGTLTLPWWHAAAAVTLLLFAVVVIAQTVMVLRAQDPAPKPADVEADLRRGLALGGNPDVRDRDEAALTRLGRAWRTADLVAAGPSILVGAVWTTALLAAVGVVVTVIRVPTGGTWDVLLQGLWLGNGVVALAVWFFVALFGGAVWLVRRGVSDRGIRRQVGRLWDVVTFWPRIHHPFAPPCYSERVVPMLAQRIRSLIDDGERGYRVVLTGHSQGSVVALAAVALLPTTVRPRVALVSYGSPLAVLYERIFPAVVHPRLFTSLPSELHSWHHVYALTEPFGFPFWSQPSTRDAEDVPDHPARSGVALWTWSASPDGPVRADTRCPACGWSRRHDATDLAEPDAEAASAGSVTRSGGAVDVCLCDPQRWRDPGGGEPSPHLAHGTYHDHAELDQHLRWLARSLARRRDGLPRVTRPIRGRRAGATGTG